MSRHLPVAFALLSLTLLSVPACAGQETTGAAEGVETSFPAAGPAVAGPAVAEPAVAEELLLGTVSRAELEADQPGWVAAAVEAQPDPQAAAALTTVAPGARVTVYLGTWCSDSKRELPRLWRGLDDAGVFAEEDLPFALEYVALDRDKRDPAGRAAAAGIEYVPTFVVTRDGVEVGRVVEESPEGIERHLLALLSGEARGVISARDDLGGS